MNYRLTEISDTKAGVSVEILCVDTEESSILLFRPFVWDEYKLSVGDEFDEEMMERLNEDSQFSRAVSRAEGMLAHSDYSRQRLISRLLHYDLEKSVCERCADYMIEKGYIKESEQAKRITRFFCIKKHWGKKRIAAELMGRGYDRKVIFAALDTVSAEEYFDSLMKFVEEKYAEPAEDRAEREKRIAALSRLGYSFSEIERALRQAEEIYKENISAND